MKTVKRISFLILITILFQNCASNPNVVGGSIEKRKYNSGWHSKNFTPPVKKEKSFSEKSELSNLTSCKENELERQSTVFVNAQYQAFSIPNTAKDTNLVAKKTPKNDVISLNSQKELNENHSSANDIDFQIDIMTEKSPPTKMDSSPFWKNHPIWGFTLLTILLAAFVLSVIGLVALQISLSWIGNAFLGFILFIVGTFIISTLLFFSLLTIFNNKRYTWKKLIANSLKFASFILIASVVFGLLVLIATSIGGA